MLNALQAEQGGQVGQFRLGGHRQRFTGRSSVVAFGALMHGGEIAVKFYCDAADAEREFGIYRRGVVRRARWARGWSRAGRASGR